MWKIVLKSGVLIISLYLAGLIAMYLMQRQFMYIPPVEPEFNGLPNGVSELTKTTAFEHDVIAWWHPPEEGEGVIVYFHGNGSAVYQAGFLYEDFMDAGFGFLAVEYPGYPGSTGEPTQDSLTTAANTYYDFLIENGVQPDNIFLYGTSLGAAVAAQLAKDNPVGKIVLEAPFYSMVNMVKQRMPIFGFRALVQDRYESFNALKGLNVPVLWLHGTQDRVIKMREGRRLYDSYSGPKDHMIIDGAGHNNVWSSGGRDKIINFLKN